MPAGCSPDDPAWHAHEVMQFTFKLHLNIWRSQQACFKPLTANGKRFRHPGTISGNSNYRVAIALIPRLQAVETAIPEALTDQQADPAN